MIHPSEVHRVISLFQAASKWYADVGQQLNNLVDEYGELQKDDKIKLTPRSNAQTFFTLKLSAIEHSVHIFRNGSDEVLRLASQFLEHGGLEPVQKMELRQWIAEVEANKDFVSGLINAARSSGIF